MTERIVAMLGRASRWLAAGTAALALAAAAAPPAGTTISNQASSTALLGAAPVANVSNTVTLVTSAPPVVAGSFLLTASETRRAAPGATVIFRHALTNTGAAADSYALAVADLPGTFDAGGLAIYADANADGVPDSATPLAGPVALSPGQTFTFVVAATAPANAGDGTQDRFEIRATSLSAGAPPTQVNVDTITIVAVPVLPQDGLSIFKSFSVGEGASPFSPVKVTLRWANSNLPSSGKTDFTVVDAIPEGFDYVRGSARWSGAAAALTDAAGGDPAGVEYDYGVTESGTVRFRQAALAIAEKGEITFDLAVRPGRAVGEVLRNVARTRWTDSRGSQAPWLETNEVTYRVTGTIAVTLVGETIPLAEPGSSVVFRNVLTNTGTAAETFEITLGPGDFPAGTTFALFAPDGITPLPDTNGNGTPDTGVVAAGERRVIVVRALLPTSTPPGAYRITKTATSARDPAARASDDDRVEAVSIACRLVLDPDMTGRVVPGGSIDYLHGARNIGNCVEEITFPTGGKSGAKSDSLPGWSSAAYLDNPVAGAQSLVGLIDATDEAITTATRFTLLPGESRAVIVRVTAPMTPTPQANLTTSRAVSSRAGPVSVTDRTTNDLEGGPADVDDVIRNYTDTGYRVETIWGVIGRELYLRADARSCNARPDTIETRTILVTGPGGEREELVGTETGPDTGIFVATPVPVANPPAVALDRRLQGRAGDVFEAEILGCGKRIWTLVTLTEPRSVVFDSRTNQPVAGAVVTLLEASAGSCTATRARLGALAGAPGSGSPNPVTTGSDGRFDFPLVGAGSYCLRVDAPNGYRWASSVPFPSLPPGRNLVVTGATSGGSYGDPFAIGPPAGPVVVDVPVDPTALSGLFVQKSASRASVEVGEFVDYTVRVKNGSGLGLSGADVTVTDDLPAGFAYVPGTARRANAALGEPQGKQGPRLVFTVGRLAAGEEAELRYRVRVGPGALQGDGVNRAQAEYRGGGQTTLSNVATAKVEVLAGVFTERGYILGRVYTDCNANGVQDGGEPGVPGVRVFLEDGTNATTDGEGKYSFYGIRNRTHVLKVDGTTVPPGTRFAAISQRHAGDGASRFVDLQSGELHRADFAIATCTPALEAEVRSRREAAEKMARNGESLVGQKLETERTPVTDPKALPATGVLGIAANANPAVAPAQSGFQPMVAPATKPADGKAPLPAGSMATPAAPLVDLEQLVPGLDGKLGFLEPADGATLAFAQATVRVKGAAGTTFRLFVNGAEVAANHVGKKSVLEDKQVQAWEYLGVDLKPGPNALAVAMIDPFGNERGREAISVVAPDRLGKVEIELPPGGAIADGRTPVAVRVKLRDAAGVPVTVRTPVTLESDLAQWRVDDLDPSQPGVQAFIEGGERVFEIAALSQPGPGRIRVSSGTLRGEATIDFLPELRQMIASGVIEGAINLRNLNPNALVPTRSSDGFEQEIRHFSRSFNDGKAQAGARAAFFLKGKIRGDYLLTAAYDSDKDTKERLFRDIQPDEFYPVYGDASQRGFDAQSTSKLYVRVDKGRSWLLYGDYTTQTTIEARKLGNYQRSLTGGKYHYENDRVAANVFASKDSTRQQIDEIRANGTSGPYTLSSPGGLVNSERVEILTRDRNQPSIIVQSVPQSRFTDYEIEPLTGRILFKAPVPSVDANLNPVSIRVTYEVESGGPDFWVAGVDGQVKLTDRIEVGGIYVDDRNPSDPMKLAGVNATVKLGERTFAFAEAAQTERELTSGKGQGTRLEVKHDSKDLQANAYVARTDASFDNPGSYLSKGRSESGGKAAWRVDEKTLVRGEVLRTEDVTTSAVRDGLAASVERSFDNRMAVEVGVRHARETNGPAIPTGTGGLPAEGLVPDEVTTVRARLTGPVPMLAGASMYAEGEVDIEDADRRILAVGGDYTLPNKGKFYFRHEFVSSITGPYGLNSRERQNTSVFGVDTEYMKDGRVFSEYRVRDALSGGDTEAAIGLRNTWMLAEGLKLGTSIERVQAVAGAGTNENTAVAFGLEYTANPLWKASTRLELRDATASDGLLHTIGLASRIAPDWTLLARNTLSIQRNKSTGEGATATTGGEHVIDRLQAGVAWRDTQKNDKDALARIEVKTEKDTTQPGIELKRTTEIVSLHASWQPRRPFLVSGRYAAKWTDDRTQGLATKYRAQLVGGRFTWEFAPRWDFGLAASVLIGEGAGSRHHGLGIEVGYRLSDNLWVSAGYNVFGYKDEDLAAGDYTVKGPYLRLRYKFDEQLFDSWGRARPPAATASLPAQAASH
ncbi:MAG: DUF11 domain-containing protein [Betaproteobacteria bacterium]|nr:DUF11 domain-containing protein [Betaproteobacteria bacterium]